jgi:CheY-like chemotaxis protein
MTRSAALRSQGAPKPARAEAKPPSAPSPADTPPSATLPPTPATVLGTRPGPSTGSDTGRRRKGETKGSRAETDATLDLLLREVRSLRETQSFILAAIEGLRRSLSSDAVVGGAGAAAWDGPGLSAIRGGRGKSVVLVDDDSRTREAAVAELQRADVPVRAYDDGSAALSAIAEQKPDVIVLELGLGGEMGGKDLVNMIKATMEWVDIPIVLWTREAVSNQKEARQIHGADEVVPKSAGPAALVARVITTFRRA